MAPEAIFLSAESLNGECFALILHLLPLFSHVFESSSHKNRSAIIQNILVGTVYGTCEMTFYSFRVVGLPATQFTKLSPLVGRYFPHSTLVRNNLKVLRVYPPEPPWPAP